LANENVPISSVNYLKSKAFDITAIGVDNPSISDKQIMNIAIEENRTIVTYDSDYGELIFKYGYKPKGGVIFIRQQPSEPFETAKIIEQLISNANLSFEQTLTVVDSNSIRQKNTLLANNNCYTIRMISQNIFDF
jgi:predicted nuclease of predicted toxin-antitoxin system